MFPFMFSVLEFESYKLLQDEILPKAWSDCQCHSGNQREGTGLQEYQAMPSLRAVAHDGGWLSTFSI